MTWSQSWEKKGETLRKMVIRTKHKQVIQEKLMRESADADVIVVAS